MLPDAISDVLPQRHGFLRPYVEYASYCSDAPEIYHVGVALTLMASACASRLMCPWMAGRILVPNLYTLLVGPSRSSRKTGSMDTGTAILQGVSNELVMPIPGSYEELITQIRERPSGLLTYREFAHFLKTTMRGYGEPIRTTLMDLFDWPPGTPYTRNLKKGKTIIEGPICLSMLAAIATELLFSYTDREEWQGGFFGRMLILYGSRGSFKMPNIWPAAAQHLVGSLHNYANWPMPACGGFSPTAWLEFSKWAQWHDSHTIDAPSRVQTFIAGSSTLAAKVALLYAADQAEFTAGAGWLISEDSMRRAMLFVDKLYLPSIYQLGERLALGPWERDRQRILDIIETRPQGVLRKDVLKTAKVSSALLDDLVNTLKEEGTITQAQNAAGPVYRRVRSTDTEGDGGGGKVIQMPGAYAAGVSP